MSAVAIASLAGENAGIVAMSEFDLGQKPVAPAIERRNVERRIGVDALEAVLRQNLAERGRDRNPALGVEPVGEVGEETVQRARPRRARNRCRDERGSEAAARGPLTG